MWLRYVCQYTQRQTDNGGVACCHAVHAVVQVGAVGDGGYHEDRNEHEQYPAGCLCMFSHEGDKVCIVQVIAFEKRNGGLCSLDFFEQPCTTSMPLPRISPLQYSHE